MKYFTLDELTYSATASARGIKNIPNAEEKKHLTELIEQLLDKIRESWGSPIYVSSGFRSYALNTVQGGSKTSAHRLGYAADLVPVNHDIKGFKRFVVKFLEENNIPFDQYIDERNQRGSEWVHVGLRNASGMQRKQYLYYDGKGNYSLLKK